LDAAERAGARRFPVTSGRVRHLRIMKMIITLVLATLLPACKPEKEAAAPAPAPASTSPPTPATAEKPAGALSDPQIAAVVLAANQVDIDAGALAAKKSGNDEVKKFAERMVTDHSAVNKAAGELAGRLGVTPEETDASRGLTSGGAAARAKLDALSGAEFDKAYVDNEVAYHEAVLGVLDKQLIPSATNAELKKMLIDVRPAFVAHLDHAKQVQATLAGKGAHAAGH
jgi:putative membrane protein